jgi:hypothetical protein
MADEIQYPDVLQSRLPVFRIRLLAAFVVGTDRKDKDRKNDSEVVAIYKNALCVR